MNFQYRKIDNNKYGKPSNNIGKKYCVDGRKSQVYDGKFNQKE